jgi:hypothetical protein
MHVGSFDLYKATDSHLRADVKAAQLTTPHGSFPDGFDRGNWTLSGSGISQHRIIAARVEKFGYDLFESLSRWNWYPDAEPS